ncbi:MAG: class I SAM-dependent rRNA methyltransferase [Planctomycetota bacterium]
MNTNRRCAQVRLKKDLVREIKRGHAWLYSHAMDAFEVPPGTVVAIWDRKGEKQIASGIADPEHPIPIRVCRTEAPFELDQTWLLQRLHAARRLRRQAFDKSTNGFRLLHGEGDGLPGVIVDVYGETAVLKIDGGAPAAFFDSQWLATWLMKNMQLERVVLRPRERGRVGDVIAGAALAQPETISFLENGMQFAADVLRGQKTGFFLDQRDNRDLVRRIAKKLEVLNLFSYNGGFSVAAGRGGASRVDSVDLAKPAIEAAKEHWLQNGLPEDLHVGTAQDCFEYLESSVKEKRKWDFVICDPPSFAPSEKARPQALVAYGKLARLASRATRAGGFLALASCSSHVDAKTFRQVNLEALGKARRKATLLSERGLPIDHPTPMAMPELRYLKFLLFRLD